MQKVIKLLSIITMTSFLSMPVKAEVNSIFKRITQEMPTQKAQDFCSAERDLAFHIMLQRQAYGNFADLIKDISSNDDTNLEPLEQDVLQLNREIIARAYFTPIRKGSLFKQLAAKSFAETLYNQCKANIEIK